MGNMTEQPTMDETSKKPVGFEAAEEKLRGEPWHQLRKMVRKHISTLDDALYNYLRKDLQKDFRRKTWLLEEGGDIRGRPSKEKLEKLVVSLKNGKYLHESLIYFANAVEAREKRIIAAAEEMLVFLDRCEGKGRVYDFVSKLDPIGYDDSDFEYDSHDSVSTSESGDSDEDSDKKEDD